jgi:hypothetical protein
VSAIEIFELRLNTDGMAVPRCADMLRCLHCGSTWSMIMDGVVSPSCVKATVAFVPSDRVGELGNRVAWFGLDDCKRCEKDRKEPNWDDLRANIETLPDARLRVGLGQLLEARRRRFR